MALTGRQAPGAAAAAYRPRTEAAVSAVAWAAKALGSSKNDKYVALLQEVGDKASDRAVATHAKDALGKYYGIRSR
jgi:hypothetical protein